VIASEHPLARLQAWYVTQCNGGWEHEFGIRIATLDNPGWHVEVDLEETDLEARQFQAVHLCRSDHDWIHAVTEDAAWSASCGPGNLAETLDLFLTWAEADTPSPTEPTGPLPPFDNPAVIGCPPPGGAPI
jgi:hypothetical protein